MYEKNVFNKNMSVQSTLYTHTNMYKEEEY